MKIFFLSYGKNYLKVNAVSKTSQVAELAHGPEVFKIKQNLQKIKQCTCGSWTLWCCSLYGGYRLGWYDSHLRVNHNCSSMVTIDPRMKATSTAVTSIVAMEEPANSYISVIYFMTVYLICVFPYNVNPGLEKIYLSTHREHKEWPF